MYQTLESNRYEIDRCSSRASDASASAWSDAAWIRGCSALWPRNRGDGFAPSTGLIRFAVVRCAATLREGRLARRRCRGQHAQGRRQMRLRPHDFDVDRAGRRPAEASFADGARCFRPGRHLRIGRSLGQVLWHGGGSGNDRRHDRRGSRQDGRDPHRRIDGLRLRCVSVLLLGSSPAHSATGASGSLSARSALAAGPGCSSTLDLS